MYSLTFDAEKAVGVHVVDPLAGTLPDDSPHPERQVCRHQVNKPEPEQHKVHIYLGYNSVDTSSELGPLTPSPPLPQVYPPLNQRRGEHTRQRERD
jgi:hypothetical protein